MQYPEDDPRHRRYKVNDGKFVLDGKRVKFSDYGGSSKEANMPLKEIDRDVEVLTASALLSRLWHIEADIKYMKESIEDLDNSYQDIETRIETLEEMTDAID